MGGGCVIKEVVLGSLVLRVKESVFCGVTI